MEFQKISSPSLRELFVDQLEHMILSGKLKIGEKLPPERQLAEMMQVSRAVVNSGISELEKKGFLIVKPRSGTYVADYRRKGTLDTLMSIMKYNGGRIRNEEIRSIFEVRIALDTLATNCVLTVSATRKCRCFWKSSSRSGMPKTIKRQSRPRSNSSMNSPWHPRTPCFH